MKKNSCIIQKWSYLSFLIIALFSSCNTGSKDPFDQAGFNAWDNNLNLRIVGYYLANTPGYSTDTIMPTRVFIDFSNGLVQAYTGNLDNSNMIDKITQKLTGGDISWFGLSQGQIQKLDFLSTQLFNKVTDPLSYAKDIMAPIEGALKDIISYKGDALFVTDFEEYTVDGKEQFENFAKNYFIDWLNRGNSIDFFITNYKEKTKDRRNVDKHLYFIVFNYGKEKKLLGEINYALQGRGFKYETFSLSTDFYSLTNDYGAEKKGGNYYDKDGNDIVGSLDAEKYLNGLKKINKNFEFYPFQQPWKDIYSNSKSLMEPGVPVPFTDFFRKLYLDASKDDVFQLKGLDVKVYNVTDDFVLFAKSKEVINHKPKLAKDANNSVIISKDETDPIALACYDSKGNLLETFKYKPKDNPQINEVFILNNELYNNGFKENKNKIELGIKFNSNFNGTQIGNPNGLLRVDIVIENCNPNFDKLGLFQWESVTVKGKPNASLAEAIRNTLDKVNPKGKVIYSYFIKAANE